MPVLPILRRCRMCDGKMTGASRKDPRAGERIVTYSVELSEAHGRVLGGGVRRVIVGDGVVS